MPTSSGQGIQARIAQRAVWCDAIVVQNAFEPQAQALAQRAAGTVALIGVAIDPALSLIHI